MIAKHCKISRRTEPQALLLPLLKKQGSTVVTVRDKDFEIYLSEKEIQTAIRGLAAQVNADYAGLNPLFIGVLNGAFMFFSDLMKHIQGDCTVGFVKASSYEGMETSGKVAFQAMDGLTIEGRHVIVVEDIIDTGNTLKALYQQLGKQQPKSLRVCTLLFKKEAYKQSLPIDYVCFKTENKFLLGYGLDYDGLGRNLPEVYILKN